MDNFDFIASDQITQLRADLSSGNVEGVNAALSKLRESLDSETFQAKSIPLLHEAAETNSFQVVCCFLENHVHINSRLVLKATMNSSYQTLEAFLNHGWDINTPIDWVTPPALAFSFHDVNLTQWFLVHGADPNRRCHQYTDRTPLSFAFQNAPFQIIKLLLDHGASLQHGQVLHYAALRESDDRLEVLQYLLDYGCPLDDIMYQNCGDEYFFHMYSGIGAPIHYAARKGMLDSVKLLVQRGASPHIRDPMGQTAADWAIKYGHMTVYNFLQGLSAGDDSEGILQFTDVPGRHFRPTSLEEALPKNEFRYI